MKILMTGATGLIGREIGKALAGKGHELFVVSRSLSKARETLPFPSEVIIGDLGKDLLRDERLSKIEGVINLMGEPVIEGRWSEEKKERIYNSRVVGTRNLVLSLPSNLKVFVSGSAIGYYGSCGDDVVKEDHGPGADFLAKTCVDWEAAAAKAPGRKVFVRTGLVMAQQGGALDQMLFPFRAGVGGVLGRGQQWMSWIHINDIVGLFVHALENSQVEGPLNGCAPNPATNKDFSKKLAEALGKSLGPNVPIFALKAIFGEASETIISSLRGSAEKAEALGYKFKFIDLPEALNDICAQFKNGEDIFYAEQFLPEPPEKVFDFFQEANNLERITPPSLKFKIEKMSTAELQKGTLIDYKLKIHGVPAKWKTEIEEWQPPFKFVDNQLLGPYRLWHHTHEFHPFCGGTLMVDRIRYRLPLGYLGWLTGAKFVRQDIENIFAFRRKFVADMNVGKKLS